MELINEFSIVAGHKVNTQEPGAFLYTKWTIWEDGGIGGNGENLLPCIHPGSNYIKYIQPWKWPEECRTHINLIKRRQYWEGKEKESQAITIKMKKENISQYEQLLRHLWFFKFISANAFFRNGLLSIFYQFYNIKLVM